MCCCCCFCFKQKTAYEMRISDWSSDVCSSDLPDRLQRWHDHRFPSWRILSELQAQHQPIFERQCCAAWHSASGVRPCYQFSSRRELLVGLRRLDVSRDRAAGVERRRALYGKSEDGRQLQRRGDAWNICIEPGSAPRLYRGIRRSEEHTSELQSLMRNSYAV